MSRIEITEEYCKGCLLCSTVCPKGILRASVRVNPTGYKVIEVNPDLADECTGCAACAQMCPDVAIVVWRDRKGKEAA